MYRETEFIIIAIFSLQANSVGDSCDASGEYTTEDDDQYERRSSCDQTLTMIDSSQDNGIDVSPINEEPKVIRCPQSILELNHPNKIIIRRPSYWVSPKRVQEGMKGKGYYSYVEYYKSRLGKKSRLTRLFVLIETTFN